MEGYVKKKIYFISGGSNRFEPLIQHQAEETSNRINIKATLARTVNRWLEIIQVKQQKSFKRKKTP